MKQLSKTFLAIFAVAAVAMFAMLALSPKAYAATEITFWYDSSGTSSTTSIPTTTLPKPLQNGVVWIDANTLTLTNTTGGDKINSAIEITGDITIVLNGINEISVPADMSKSALKVTGNLTIIGSGSLIATGSSGNPRTSAISCTGTITIGDGSTSPTIIATGGDSSGNNVGGASGIYLGGNLEIKSGDVNITGGKSTVVGGGGAGVDAYNNGNVIISGGSSVTIEGGAAGGSSTAGGGNGVRGNVEINTDVTDVDITGGSGLGLGGGGGGGGAGVSGNLTISQPTGTGQTIKITGGAGIAGSTDGGDGGDGVSGNLITPTGIITPNIDIKGGMGTNATVVGGKDGIDGKQVGGSHFSLSNPPQPTPQVQPQQQPARDVIYPTERTETTRGVYTFSSSGMFSDFSGIWIHGYAIPSSYYTAFQNADGSVSITLADWYVRTLNYNEQYLLHFVFNSGYGITKFYR